MDLVGNDDIRKLHFKSLWKLVTPRSKLLITGRPNYFINPAELKSALGMKAESKNLPYCEALYLKPFDQAQIMMALRNAESSVQNGIQKIIREQASVSFLDLISRPSHLFLVSQIWDKRELEKKYHNLTSAMIIHEFLQDCFERQAAKIKDGPYFFLSPLEREYFMIGIAIKMYKMGTTVISKELLYNTVSELIDMFPQQLSSENSAYLNLRDGKSIQEFAFEDENSLYAIINDVRICGVLVHDYVNNGFVFAHKSFYDLLVAKYYLGKEVKFHDSAMTISKALSSSQAYNVRLKNDFVVRKLLAELIASKISLNMGNINAKIKCRKIFEQCCKIILRSYLKISPQQLFIKCLHSRPNTTKQMIGTAIDRHELSRTITLFFLPPILLILFVTRDLSFISSYKAEALAYYAEIQKYNDISPAANAFHLGFIPMICASAALILIFMLSIRTKNINQKAEIVLLTWYHTCRDNQIPEKTIYSFIPDKFKEAFASYIEGHNLTEIQERYEKQKKK